MTEEQMWQEFVTNGTIIPVISIILAFCLLFFGIVGGLCVAFVKAVRGGGSTQTARRIDRSEAMAFQELERGFRRMEDRLSSLETLLMGRAQGPMYTSDYE